MESAAFSEIGLSLENFKRFLGRISSVLLLGEDRELKEPLTKFTMLFYELCMVFLDDYRNIIFCYNFEEDIQVKIIETKDGILKLFLMVRIDRTSEEKEKEGVFEVQKF